MAVVNIKSTVVSNADSTPVILNNPYQAYGGDYTETAFAAAGATDSAASVYRFFRIPSGARIMDVQVMNDANTAGTSYKCGVLFVAGDGGGVVVAGSDQICFAAVTMAAARNIWTSLYFPSILAAGGLVANTGLRIWELLGLTADPFKIYDFAISATTAGTAGGNMAVQLSYVR